MSSFSEERRDKLAFIWDYIGVVLFAVLLLVSFGLLAWAATLDHESAGREIVRDIGIGLMVAAVVGGIYDLHARARFDQHTIAGVLNTIMGEVIRKDVWTEVKKQVIESEWIRENLHIKMELREAEEHGLRPGEMLLWVQMRYNACNLRSQPRTVKIRHNLDFHRRRGDFPRYTRIRIAGVDHSLETLNIREGELCHEIELRRRDSSSPVDVLVEREEVVYVPGSYVVTMGNIAKGLSIDLDKIPKDLRAHVMIRPHWEKAHHLKVHDPLERGLEDMILLPGQVLEFRFEPAPESQKIMLGEGAASAVPHAGRDA